VARIDSETGMGTGVLPLSVCESLCDELVRAASPSEALARIEAAREAMWGPGLLTVNLVAARPEQAGGVFLLQRAWTSHPDQYPVGGGKRKSATPWTEQLLVRGEIFVGEGEAALAAVFDDASRIAGMGLRSVINVPLLVGGECRATFNVLGPQPGWSPQQVATVRLLALLAQPFVLQLSNAKAGAASSSS
jgi:GAF domain-containing protein